MSARERYLPLAASAKAPVPGSRRIGPALPAEPVSVTILLRRCEHGSEIGTAAERRLTRPDYARSCGASDEDVAAVGRFAAAHGIDVTDVSPVKRTVTLGGTAASVADAFRVTLSTAVTDDGVVFRSRSGAVNLPIELAPVVQGVFGLDDRPQAVPHFRRLAAPAAAETRGFLPTDVAALYRYPRDVDGDAQTVAIIELGGGFRTRDIVQYFGELGLASPTVAAVSVDGARNAPTGDAKGPDGEVMLDIEVLGAVAPRARIVVYFAPNTSQGFLNAVLAAVHDDVRRPSVVSISWGAPESDWTRQSLEAMDGVFRDGGLLGVSICAATGDSGSSDGLGDGEAHVDFPASSPHVLACGGTRLVGSGGRVRRETVWGGPAASGATGGGVSSVFGLPDWQRGAGVPRSPGPGRFAGRGLPDIAGNADPATGYRVLVDGEAGVIGGTSAVAPLLAGLIALLNQRLGRPVGFLNPLLYASPRGRLFRDVTAGTNGAFVAARGWDACTGLGSPIGDALAEWLASTRGTSGV